MSIIHASEIPRMRIQSYDDKKDEFKLISTIDIHVTLDEKFALHHDQKTANTMKEKLSLLGLKVSIKRSSICRAIILNSGMPILFLARPLTAREQALHDDYLANKQKRQRSSDKGRDTLDERTGYVGHL